VQAASEKARELEAFQRTHSTTTDATTTRVKAVDGDEGFTLSALTPDTRAALLAMATKLASIVPPTNSGGDDTALAQLRDQVTQMALPFI
jgi:hypothetical protein